MISQILIGLIEKNADILTKRLMKDLLGREETKHYRNLPEERIYNHVFDVYSRLDSWLSGEKSKANIKKFYSELGKKRYSEGIPLSEMIMAFMLMKRHLWLYVLENQVVDSAYELNRTLELNNRVVLFFDRIIYFATIGYEEEIAKPQAGGILSKIKPGKK
jgi:hypothetical protein